MMKIGEFHAQGDGFTGHLRSLGFHAELTIVPAQPSETKNAPDYRVHLGRSAEGPEIGAGWTHKGERAGTFIVLTIDDPQLPRPIRANLFRPVADGDAHPLFWQRQTRRRQAD